VVPHAKLLHSTILKRPHCVVPKVWRAVGKTVYRGLHLSKRGPIHLFDDAESAKNLRTVEHLTRSLCRAGADRKSLIVAVGGGVVGDVAGFAAAAYLRGVKLVHTQQPSSVKWTAPSRQNWRQSSGGEKFGRSLLSASIGAY